MKKWENAEVVELGLENTKEDSCPESANFEAGLSPAGPFKCTCNKKTPEGKDAYEPGLLGFICKYYKCGCTYNPTTTQS